jgi:hypothetical protein
VAVPAVEPFAHADALGNFVELETVSDGVPGMTDHAEHDRIAEALTVDLSRSAWGSYIDLIASTSSGQRGSSRG